MTPKLTTQVIDLTTGRPAEGMRIELWSLDGKHVLLKAVNTAADGRPEGPLLDAATLAVGSYELVYFVKDYFVNHHKDSVFLDRVPVRFVVASASTSYHLPIQISPWSYSVCRG